MLFFENKVIYCETLSSHVALFWNSLSRQFLIADTLLNPITLHTGIFRGTTEVYTQEVDFDYYIAL